MGRFLLGLAGHSFAVECRFGSTPHYCAAYPATGPVEAVLTVTEWDLAQCQARLREEAAAEGLKTRQFPDPFLERTVIQEKAADYLGQFGIFLFHGSTVGVDGWAYLFTAPCGTGKSTHTRLWRQRFGDRAVMVNDDRPLLSFQGGQVLAHGTPWSGKHGLDANVCLPLAGVCVLSRGRENRIAPASREEVLPFLKSQARPQDAPLAEALAAAVPLWQMACNQTPEAAEIAYRAMGRVGNSECGIRS